MSIDNFSVEFQKLDKEDDEGIGNLVSSISQSSYTIPLELINILHTSDKNSKEKAAIMVLELGNLVFTPLLHSLNSESHDDYVWDIKSLVNIQIENRSKIAKILDGMLKDKRILTPPELKGPVEEKPIPRRVCDEAYLLSRLLFSLDEDPEEQFINEDIFLNLSDNEKDTEINRFISTKRWVNLEETFFNEDE